MPMGEFNICIIDDENMEIMGSLQISLLIKSHFLSANSGIDPLAAALKLNEQSIPCYISNAKPHELKGIKCTVLTAETGPKISVDEILDKAVQLNSDIYIVDVNLKGFGRGKKIKDLKNAGTKIAGELSLKNKNTLIIVYSAKTGIKKALKILKGTDVNMIKYIGIDSSDNSSEEFFNYVNGHISKMQVNIIYGFSLAENTEYLSRMKKLEKDNLEQFSQLADEKTTTNWTLRTLFPRQINMILKGIKIEDNKREIISLLKCDFRKLVSKLSEHKNISYIFEQIRALDFSNSCKNGKSQYTGLEQSVLDGNLTIQEAIQKEFGFIGDNFDPEKIKEDLNKFFNSKKNQSDHVLEILGPDWNLARTTMISEFGVYYGHIVHIAQVAIQNIINHQEPDLYSKEYPPLKISSIYDEQNNSLIFEFHVGKTKSNERFELKEESNEIWIVKGSGIEYPLIMHTDKATEVNLNELNDGKLIDILKIVCYLWRSEFHYIHGVTKIEFTWDNQKKQFNSKMTEDEDKSNEIKYIVKCKKLG